MWGTAVATHHAMTALLPETHTVAGTRSETNVHLLLVHHLDPCESKFSRFWESNSVLKASYESHFSFGRIQSWSDGDIRMCPISECKINICICSYSTHAVSMQYPISKKRGMTQEWSFIIWIPMFGLKFIFIVEWKKKVVKCVEYLFLQLNLKIQQTWMCVFLISSSVKNPAIVHLTIGVAQLLQCSPETNLPIIWRFSGNILLPGARHTVLDQGLIIRPSYSDSGLYTCETVEIVKSKVHRKIVVQYMVQVQDVNTVVRNLRTAVITLAVFASLTLFLSVIRHLKAKEQNHTDCGTVWGLFRHYDQTMDQRLEEGLVQCHQDLIPPEGTQTAAQLQSDPLLFHFFSLYCIPCLFH